MTNKQWDTITELPDSVTTNPLWATSSWRLSFENGQLTHTKLAFWLKNFGSVGDLTADEEALRVAFQSVHDEWNKSWDFTSQDTVPPFQF